MEKYLDDLIRILEESLSNQDFNKTTELEKKLQNLMIQKWALARITISHLSNPRSN